MTSTTSPDNIVYWTNSDPGSLVSESALQASSIQTALDLRQVYSFRWADATARAAQTGMVYGSQGFQTDTGAGYLFNGSSWQLWDKPLASFTPTLSGINIGTTGTNTATWSVSSGRAFVEGAIVLGGTGISVGATSASMPVTSVVSAANTPRGIITFADVGSTSYPGFITYASTTTVNFIVWGAAGTYVNNAVISSTVPFTWATGDYISYSYSFIPA